MSQGTQYAELSKVATTAEGWLMPGQLRPLRAKSLSNKVSFPGHTRLMRGDRVQPSAGHKATRWEFPEEASASHIVPLIQS